MRLGAMLGVVVLASVASAAGDGEAVMHAAPTCDKGRAHCFEIQLHVVDLTAPPSGGAAADRGFVATPEWIAAQVAGANRHFAALDVGFQLAGVDTLPASFDHVESRGQRDALAAQKLGGKVIHVFVVGQLDDVDEEGAIAYGVTWHRRNDDRKYVIVSAAALERTLAHELGHFFGLPHSTYAISIMNKSDRSDPPIEQRTFADEEIAAMRPKLAQLLHDKVIADVAPR